MYVVFRLVPLLSQSLAVRVYAKRTIGHNCSNKRSALSVRLPLSFPTRHRHRFLMPMAQSLTGQRFLSRCHRNVSILRNTHCMLYGLIVILPPHNNQTE